MFYNPLLLPAVSSLGTGLQTAQSAGIAVSLQPTISRRAVPLFGIAHIK